MIHGLELTLGDQFFDEGPIGVILGQQSPNRGLPHRVHGRNGEQIVAGVAGMCKTSGFVSGQQLHFRKPGRKVRVGADQGRFVGTPDTGDVGRTDRHSEVRCPGLDLGKEVSRLSVDNRGRVVYRYKQPFRDGSTQVVFEPLDFIALTGRSVQFLLAGT